MKVACRREVGESGCLQMARIEEETCQEVVIVVVRVGKEMFVWAYSGIFIRRTAFRSRSYTFDVCDEKLSLSMTSRNCDVSKIASIIGLKEAFTVKNFNISMVRVLP